MIDHAAFLLYTLVFRLDVKPLFISRNGRTRGTLLSKNEALAFREFFLDAVNSGLHVRNIMVSVHKYLCMHSCTLV